MAPADLEAIAARVDPYVEKSRVLVMSDIANEPDDQMSMVRFLVYSNDFDVEGVVASTSTWMRNRVRPDVMLKLIDGYEQVQPTLATHAPGFVTAAVLRTLVVPGQPGYGMNAVGSDRMSRGAELIIQAADKNDSRPLWVLAWGEAEGGIPSAAAEGPPQPPPRATLDGADRSVATATLRTPGIAHIILAVEDDGKPSLTSYRRIILHSGPER